MCFTELVTLKYKTAPNAYNAIIFTDCKLAKKQF